MHKNIRTIHIYFKKLLDNYVANMHILKFMG
jgi:hypothetical protein